MNDIFKVFISMSLSGSLLILALLVLRHFLKSKISRQWQYYIWLIVIARLLLPFAPDTNLLGSIFKTAGQAIAQTNPVQLPQQEQDGLPDNKNALPSNMDQEELKLYEQFSGNGPIQELIALLVNNIWLVWLMTALILLIRKITVYQSFIRFIKAGQSNISDIELLDKLSILAEQSKVKVPVGLCINPLISSPMLIGFIHPCIVLPDADISDTDFQYTVQHELIHYRRKDMFYKWLVQAVVCLHWFNPLVYLMSREIDKACEFSCDEALIAGLDSCGAQAYGKTLLDAMAKSGHYKESPASVTLSKNKELLKERLNAIMNFKKKSKAIVGITIILTIFFSAGAITAGAYSLPKEADEKEYSSRQESLIDSFAPFRSYGLLYNAELDRVFFNGQEVKAFVDLREPIPGGGYSFNLGYIESDSDSTLYLMTVQNTQGKVIGIQKMPDELKDDLYGAYSESLTEELFASDLEEKADSPSGSEWKNEYVSGIMYRTFDAVTHLTDENITASDKFGRKDIPQEILDWISTCKGSDTVNVKRAVMDGKIDAWVYYDSDIRLAWNMDTEGTTIKLTLTDNVPEAMEGGTVIHYQAPTEYRDLEVFYNREKLITTVQ
ncbi:Signal transducer regulating beta-lactamase production, contains metallopeptidase domain [Lachnospiraceae bacterium NLAE-zl-G231]|nr:Signal transducer regulating beta-lactamase production, contains metallopeptidase domain [Lachnospiraceae bacterium NLAE-zl-G231]